MPASVSLDTVIDFTPIIELQTSPDTLVASLNIFDTPVRHRTDAISVGRDTRKKGLIAARERGGERNYLTTSKEQLVAVRIPFFPLDHNIKAQDIQSLRTYAATLDLNNESLRTEQEVVDRYMNQILADVANTKEKIYTSALFGVSYVGVDADGFSNKNFDYNWYTVFGQTQKVVDVAFGDANVNPASVVEQQARAYIIDNKLNGTSVTNIIALCSRSFFAKLVNNVFVRQAYQMQQGRPNPLLDRISGNADAQVFVWNGVTYLEDIHSNVPADQAILFPTGIDNMFQLHYAPADTPEYANTPGQDVYTFMMNEHRVVKLESEFSLLAVNTRPELCVLLRSV